MSHTSPTSTDTHRALVTKCPIPSSPLLSATIKDSSPSPQNMDRHRKLLMPPASLVAPEGVVSNSRAASVFRLGLNKAPELSSGRRQRAACIQLSGCAGRYSIESKWCISWLSWSGAKRILAPLSAGWPLLLRLRPMVRAYRWSQEARSA